MTIAIQDIAGDGQSSPSNIMFYTGNGKTSVSVGTNVDDTFVIGNDNNGVNGLFKFNKGLTIQSNNFRLFADQAKTKPFVFHLRGSAKDPQIYIPVPNQGYIGDPKYYFGKGYFYNMYNRTLDVGFGRKSPQEGHLRIAKDKTSGVFQSVSIWARKYTGLSNNVHITNQSTLGVTSSSKRYKLDISNIPNELELSDRLLNVKTKTWFDKNVTEGLASDLTEKSLGIDLSNENENEPLPVGQIYGLIAEEVEEAGLGMYVVHDEKTGKPEGVSYDRMWTLLIPKVKELQNRIIQLEDKLKDRGQ